MVMCDGVVGVVETERDFTIEEGRVKEGDVWSMVGFDDGVEHMNVLVLVGRG